MKDTVSTDEPSISESSSSLYNIYNIVEDRDRDRDRDFKILRSIYILAPLWDSAKKFAHFMEISTSVLVSKALMEYMVAHASELPVEASFNLVPIPKKPKVCGFQGCKAEAVATGLYVPRNEEFLLCEVHLAEAKKRKDFQVSR